MILLSLNYHHAPIEIRERLAFSPTQLHDAYIHAERYGFLHLIILSTCNRVELITQSECPGICERLSQFLGEMKGVPLSEFQDHLKFFQGDAALEHLIRVASGLDSMVMGEPQIFGQVKQAYQEAKTAGWVNAKLDFTFQHVFNTVKTIRHQTMIGHCPVSVAYSSMKLAQTQALPPHPEVLLLGAGETAALILKHISTLNPKKVTLVNRTLENAQALAHERYPFEMRIKRPEQLEALCHSESLDVIIGTTASETPWITLNMLPKARQRPLLCIDLAVPRDIEAQVGTLPYVTLYSIDDIQSLIQNNTLQRTQAALKAHTLIEQSLKDFNQRKHFKDAEHDLVKFREHLHTLKDQAMRDAKRKLQNGQDPQSVLEAMARTLVNTLLHEPSSRLYHADSKHHQEKLVDSIKLLWG